MTEFVDGASGRRNVCDKKSQRYAKENRTALISVTVNVTNNKRLCSTFCRPTIDRGTDRDEASRGLFATAELLVVTCLYNNNSEQLGKRLRMLWRCLSQTGRIQWHITWTSSIYSQLTRVSDRQTESDLIRITLAKTGSPYRCYILYDFTASGAISTGAPPPNPAGDFRLQTPFAWLPFPELRDPWLLHSGRRDN